MNYNKKKIDYDMKKRVSDMNKIKKMLTQIMNQKHNYSPENKYPPNSQNTTTVVPDTKKDQPLERGNSTKNGGMWTLKHEIISPKFYKIFINT